MRKISTGRRLFTIPAACCLLAGAAHAGPPVEGPEAAPAGTFEPHVWAVEFAVPDPVAATRPYVEGLGFVVEREAPSGAWAVLRLDRLRLVLRQGHDGAAPAGSARIYLNLRVGDLTLAGRHARKAGFELAAPREIAIGHAISITDPGGNPLNLLDVDGDEMPPDAAPKVFNVGLRVPDMQRAEAFFTSLGFGIFTRDYLPETLVLQRHGAVGLVLHPATGRGEGDAGRLALQVESLERAAPALARAGVTPSKKPAGHWSGRPTLVLEAPAGVVEIFESPGSD